MKCGRARRCRSALTLVEMLVVMVIITILIGLLLAVISRVRQWDRQVTCISNLRQIGTAFTAYAATTGNNRMLPNPVVIGRSWEQILCDPDPAVTYITDPRVFQCPSDNEVYPLIGSSYDWRDTGRADTTLAGHPIGDEGRTRSNPVLAYEELPGWHAKKKMNAVFLDGSAQVMDQDACLGDIETPIRLGGP